MRCVDPAFVKPKRPWLRMTDSFLESLKILLLKGFAEVKKPVLLR